MRQAWDWLILCLLLYSSFAVPYSLAFGAAPSGAGAPLAPADAADAAVDAVFLADVALTFATACYDAQGGLVTDGRAIARRYARGWLLPDLAGSFPFDLVAAAAVAGGGGGGGQGDGVGGLRLVRALKLTRAARYG